MSTMMAPAILLTLSLIPQVVLLSQPRVPLPQSFPLLHQPLHVRTLLGLPTLELPGVDVLLLQAIALVASATEPRLLVQVHADRPEHGVLGKPSQVPAKLAFAVHQRLSLMVTKKCASRSLETVPLGQGGGLRVREDTSYRLYVFT